MINFFFIFSIHDNNMQAAADPMDIPEAG